MYFLTFLHPWYHGGVEREGEVSSGGRGRKLVDGFCCGVGGGGWEGGAGKKGGCSACHCQLDNGAPAFPHRGGINAGRYRNGILVYQVNVAGAA